MKILSSLGRGEGLSREESGVSLPDPLELVRQPVHSCTSGWKRLGALLHKSANCGSLCREQLLMEGHRRFEDSKIRFADGLDRWS
jgi:hypothetical protein